MPDRNSADPFVDPAGLMAFWEREYLQGYVAHGGSSVKWLRGREGSGKSRLLDQVASCARDAGYMTATSQAGSGALGRFDDLYREMMGQIPLDALARGIARATAQRLGAGAWLPESGVSVAEYLRGQGRPGGAVDDDVARSFDFLYASRNVDAPVAVAARRLAMPYVADGPQARQEAETAGRWLQGRKLQAAERRYTGIYLTLDRYSARDVLRSILHLLQLCGMRGMVWTIDRLEALLASRGLAALDGAGAPSSALGVYSTAKRRLDAYEGVRELIDEGGHLPGFMMVFAGRPEVFDDERAGLASYPALAMRVQAEIDADAINRYNDVQDLDRLWQTDWPSHQDALVAAYGAAGGLGTLDLSAVLSGTAISPVRRLVERLTAHGAAEGGGRGA
jgi:hypothetical protein